MIAGQIVFDEVKAARLEAELARGVETGAEPWATLAQIVEHRRRCTGVSETGLWALDLMQGDLGFVAVSEAVLCGSRAARRAACCCFAFFPTHPTLFREEKEG